MWFFVVSMFLYKMKYMYTFHEIRLIIFWGNYLVFQVNSRD